MKDIKSAKLTLELLVAIVAIIAGLTLLFLGLFLPPKGIIDSSVLIAWGEIATFAGSVLGIDLNYNYKFNKLQYESGTDKSRDKGKNVLNESADETQTEK